jgi:hydrogenase small subunit
VTETIEESRGRPDARGGGLGSGREDGTSSQRRPGLTGLGSRNYDEVHVFWLAGMSCDGCTISVSGATQPSLEDLLRGTVPGLPRVVLHHPVLSVEAGHAFTDWYYKAWKGELGAPYVMVLEGSATDEEELAKPYGGYWAGLGAEASDGGQGPWGKQPVDVNTWVERLAPGAAASMAIGTCATWGGIPASAGNPTGARSLMDLLGGEYLSKLGLPVINVPGCAPVGDNFTETVAAVLMYLEGIGPLPEFDELGRPAWLFKDTVHRGCTRAGWYEEGVFADEYGDPECLVEIGCWGPVVNCNIVVRGAIDGLGGCMKTGGICIGCTMPGFPDKFSPFYKTPPGSSVSTAGSKTLGSFIRPLRRLTQRQLNMESLPRWKDGTPSAWAKVDAPSGLDKISHYFYEKLQYAHATRPRHEDTEFEDKPKRRGEK